MIPFRKSIGFRLLGISFIVLALPLLVDSFILIQRRYKHTIADAKGYLIEANRLREIPLARLQPLGKPLLEIFTYSLGLEKAFPSKPDPSLNEKLQRMAEVGNFSGMFLVKITDEGQYIVVAGSQPEFIGRNYASFFGVNDLFYPAALERGDPDYISYDSTKKQPYFIVAHVVEEGGAGKPTGLLVIADDITGKLPRLLEPDTERYPIDFALILPSSIVFAASDPSLRFNYFHPLPAEYARQFVEFIEDDPKVAIMLPKKPIPIKKLEAPFFEFTWEGQTYVGYSRKLPNSNLSLLSYANKETIFRTPINSFFNIYSGYLLILIIGGTIAYLITYRMARPMQKLSGVMHKIQEGDYQERYQKDRFGFEINTLGEIFNETVDAVIEHKRVAEEERVARETLASELRLGRQAQQTLLPHSMPSYPGVELAEIYIPAIEVGGDFFDAYIKKCNGKEELIIAIADASGKGVQACFFSLSLRNMLRICAKRLDDVAKAMTAANQLFQLDTGDTGMFVTVLMGSYDHETQKLTYYSCGHNPGYLRRRDGSVEILDHLGVAMGVISIEGAEAKSVQLAPGDTVVFYTDGVTEAHNEAYAPYGEERLMALLGKEGGRGAKELVELIVEDVSAFVGKAPQHDDITLLVMKIK